MRTIFRVQILRGALFAAIAVVGAFILNTGAVAAHDGDHEDTTSTYTAKAGDSQTIFARDAINHYAKENEVKLGDEQRIYAETKLVKKMGDRYLDIGEKVTIEQSDIKSVVDDAGKLNTAQQAAWQPYAQTVDYSDDGLAQLTEEPGESSSSSSDSNSESDEKKESTDEEAKKESEDKEEGSAWYTNVFTWILIIAAAIIAWSLFASRKDDK